MSLVSIHMHRNCLIVCLLRQRCCARCTPDLSSMPVQTKFLVEPVKKEIQPDLSIDSS